MAPIITLTTDFGLADGYVAAMKGVILSINPGAVIVDVTHQAPAQDVFHGAYALGAAWSAFPYGTVHVAVVDPGVGSRRRAIALANGGHLFVGPDNGVLSLVLPDDPATPEPAFQPIERPLPPGCAAVDLTEQRYWGTTVSGTFHGRDIFAPVAAYLSLGVPMHALGPTLSRIQRLSLGSPAITASTVDGAIVHIDAFGNAMTNIRREHVLSLPVKISVGDTPISGTSTSYAEGGSDPMAVWGSNGTLEIAVKEGSAGHTLALQRGDRVRVSLTIG